jgi:hypothetical protein
MRIKLHHVGEDRKTILAKDIEWTDARLSRSNRRAKPSRDLSTDLASLMSHINISFCESPL